MVKYQSRRGTELNGVFGSLADPTRRDILRRLHGNELSVGDIAASYSVSLAAISKHLRVLETARLVRKRRHGRQQFIRLSPGALKDADDYLERYRALWEARLDKLEALLKKN